MDLASQFHFKKLKQENTSVTRLKGELFIDHSKHLLLSGNAQSNSKCTPLLHWGSLDLESLLIALSRIGIKATVEQEGMRDTNTDIVSVVHVHEPSRAVIEVKATSTVITAADKNLASLIFETIGTLMDGV